MSETDRGLTVQLTRRITAMLPRLGRGVRAEIAAGRRAATGPGNLMLLSSHWSRITSVVQRAGATAASVREAHTAALEKLDSADYALARLMEDLADIMAVPNATTEATGAALVMPFSRGSFEEARQRDRAEAARALEQAKGTKSAA